MAKITPPHGPAIRTRLASDGTVALFDLGPTMLEWAGVDVPVWMVAQFLSPYFKDGAAPERTKVFAEHSIDALLSGTRLMTMLLVGKMKLVHFVDIDEGQLLNLDTDPKEQINLWDDPAFATTRASMVDDILKWRSESGLKTQGFVEACVRGAHAMMSPPLTIRSKP